MKLDNKRNTYRIWLSRLIMTTIFALVVVLLIFIPWFDNPESGFTKYHLIILVSGIYLVINLVITSYSIHYTKLYDKLFCLCDHDRYNRRFAFNSRFDKGRSSPIQLNCMSEFVAY